MPKCQPNFYIQEQFWSSGLHKACCHWWIILASLFDKIIEHICCKEWHIKTIISQNRFSGTFQRSIWPPFDTDERCQMQANYEYSYSSHIIYSRYLHRTVAIRETELCSCQNSGMLSLPHDCFFCKIFINFIQSVSILIRILWSFAPTLGCHSWKKIIEIQETFYPQQWK